MFIWIAEYWKVVGGLYMGWSLGANDAANVFGTGVAARVVKFRTAAILISVFALLGAALEGPKCMEIIKDVSEVNLNAALIASLSAAVTMTVMTVLGIPSSTSQAIMGAILGGGFALGVSPDWSKLTKVVICWIFTPIGAAFISFVLYHLFDWIFKQVFKGASAFEFFIRWGLILSGCYGSYSLGANNVANTTGVYYSAGLLTAQQAALIGGLSIIVGVVTYSHKVMETVGNRITQMGPLGAFIAVLANALTIHFYTQLGVPVSSSQAVVGAVIGIGLVRGISAVSFKIIGEIAIGWATTPLIAGLLAWGLTLLFG